MRAECDDVRRELRVERVVCGARGGEAVFGRGHRPRLASVGGKSRERLGDKSAVDQGGHPTPNTLSGTLQPLSAIRGFRACLEGLDEHELLTGLPIQLPRLWVHAEEPTAASPDGLAVVHLLELGEEALRALSELGVEEVGVVAARHLVERAVEADHGRAFLSQQLEVEPVLDRPAVARLHDELQRCGWCQLGPRHLLIRFRLDGPRPERLERISTTGGDCSEDRRDRRLLVDRARPCLPRELRLAVVGKAHPHGGVRRGGGELSLEAKLHRKVAVRVEHLRVRVVVKLRLALAQRRELDLQQKEIVGQSSADRGCG
eukprot:scaffold98949_cov66-Phaeocystis_antarctica.AAC.7